MKLNRADLRKILYDFNSISNRLLQADFNDYTNVIIKFVHYIKNTPLINDFIADCGSCDWNMAAEFDKINKSYGHMIFSLGETDSEEIKNVFAILCYIADHQVQVHYGIAMGYSSSNKYQDKIKAFNDRVVMILIRHIENYLTKIGIDMGMNEKVTYSITVENGQVNISNDSSVINANYSGNIDINKFMKLTEEIKASLTALNEEDRETAMDCLEVVEEQVISGQPKKSFMKTAFAGLQAIKGSAEFAASIAALWQFVQSMI